MKIGLIGAPGAGKTRLAAELAEKIGCAQVIDNYVPALEKEMNVAMGPFAGYIGNVAIALGRYSRERNATECHTITCGTLIETAIYTAVYFASLDEVLNDQEKAEVTPRVDATMRIMSCFFLDLFKYDHILYLPAAETSNVDARFVDRQLQAAIAGFKICPVTTLENAETRLEDALSAVKVDEVPAR